MCDARSPGAGPATARDNRTVRALHIRAEPAVSSIIPARRLHPQPMREDIASEPRAPPLAEAARAAPRTTHVDNAHGRCTTRATTSSASTFHEAGAYDSPPRPHATAASPPYTRLRWPSRRARSTTPTLAAQHPPPPRAPPRRTPLHDAHSTPAPPSPGGRTTHARASPHIHTHPFCMGSRRAPHPHPRDPHAACPARPAQSCARRASHESVLAKTAGHPPLQRRRLRNTVTAAGQHPPPPPPRHARVHSARTPRLRLLHPPCARASLRIRTLPGLHGPTSRAASHPHPRASVRRPSCTPARMGTTGRSIRACPVLQTRRAPHHRAHAQT
ncbi:hypothetical protein DFH09DRAFT_1311735 [Mycena vulgaris]|nr:hypothetical protein DFH09DRAFT_1311735 [Mycena vulgaris]